jgi:ABC-2 type transport system permease protein
MMKRGMPYIDFILMVAILIVINIIGGYFYYQIDLTEENRFTLADPTEEVLENIDDVINIQVLLEGDFPAGFKRLQSGVDEVLRRFKASCPYLDVTYLDPNEGGPERVNALRQRLAETGIAPVNLRVNDGTALQEKLIYPYAIFNFAGRSVPVNFLENNPGFNQEQNLNNSIGQLEYKFINAINKIKTPIQSTILFLDGRGELSEAQTFSFNYELKRFNLTDRLPIDSTIAISTDVDLLIVAKPRQPFSQRDKFIIDQYIMNGGRVLWLIDRLDVSLDSIGGRNDFVPMPIDINLDDMFFKYGFRINNDLVLDLECSRIPQVVGQQGGRPQIELIPWYYHTLAVPFSDHPISKNLDRINLFFPSSIDSVKTKTQVEKTSLLSSSQYSRKQLVPTRVNFEILRYEPDPDKFDKPHQVVAMLLEGQFPSLFENNVTEEMTTTFKRLGLEFRETSVKTKMIVISDGDIAKNLLDKNGKPQPLGFNKWENFVFESNSDLLLNSVEYLLDDTGLLEARSKDLKLRLLDKVRCQEERTYWQMFNIGLPLLFLLVFGIGFNYFRRRKYT